MQFLNISDKGLTTLASHIFSNLIKISWLWVLFTLGDLVIFRGFPSSKLNVVSLSSALYRFDAGNVLSLTTGVPCETKKNIEVICYFSKFWYKLIAYNKGRNQKEFMDQYALRLAKGSLRLLVE